MKIDKISTMMSASSNSGNSPTGNVVSLKRVSFSYAPSIALLKSLDFNLMRGQIVSIGGDAGSGKSTFLKIAATLIEPNAGEILLEGQRIWNLSDAKRAELRKRVSYFFSEGALIANMSVFDNIALSLRYHHKYGPVEIEKKVMPWIEKFGLSEYKFLLPALLTIELKRRASLIRAFLIENPAVCFWDDAEELEGDAREITAMYIKDAAQKGIPSIIVGNDDWTRSLSDINFRLVDGMLNRW